MKKSLIALGIAAAAATAAQANTTTLYGRVGYTMDIAEAERVIGTGTLRRSIENTELDLASAPGARLGVRGTEDLPNGMQAFYNFQFQASGARGLNSTRQANLGLRGDFGQITIGRQNTVWNSFLGFNEVMRTVGGHNAGVPGRVSKAISYVSPEFSGLTIGAAVVLDGSYTTDPRTGVERRSGLNFDDNVDVFDIGVSYAGANGLVFALDHMRAQTSPTKFQATGGHIGYDGENFGIGLGVQKTNAVLGSPSRGSGIYYILGTQYSQGANTYRAEFDLIDPDSGDRGYNFALGYQYNFSRRTSTWIEGEYGKNIANGDSTAFRAVVGIRHDF